jgi:hypothetical protein
MVDIQEQAQPEQLEDWQIVPTSFEGICEWVYILHNPQSIEGSRSYLLLYKSPGETANPEFVYPVTLRIQGIIKSCNIAPLGSWNG